MVHTAIVIPNHLPDLTNYLLSWKEWRDPSIRVIIVEDKPKVDVELGNFDNVTLYSHTDIKKDLGKDSWIIPKHGSACRSYGYYKAWQLKPEFILTVDNDCYPEKDKYWVSGHEDALKQNTTLDWINTGPNLYYRGFPYLIREKSPVYLNHGLWSNIPDLDAATALHNPDFRLPAEKETQIIPRHNFFPMCGMNLAWRSELTPAMYFGLFGPEYGFDQYDDIWAGVLVKKVMDHLGLAASSGYPSVEHRKQSNVFLNMRKQAPGLGMNEHFWKEVQNINLTEDTVLDCYRELIEKLPDTITDEPSGWTKKFKKAALIWINLFKEKK